MLLEKVFLKGESLSIEEKSCRAFIFLFALSFYVSFVGAFFLASFLSAAKPFLTGLVAISGTLLYTDVSSASSFYMEVLGVDGLDSSLGFTAATSLGFSSA